MMMMIPVASAVLALTAAPAGADLRPSIPATAVVEQGQGQGQGKARGEAQQQRGNAGGGQQARGSQGQGQGRQQQPAQRGSEGQGPGQARQQRPARPVDQGPGQLRRQAPGNSGSASGRSAAARSSARGRVSSAELRRSLRSLQPEVRRFAASNRAEQRIAAGAAARAVARGLAPSAIVLTSRDDGIRIANRRDELLLDLGQREARDLGYWEMRRLGDHRPHSGSPSFCRSGEGHPVWGREWCIRQGFGLGGDDVLWSRARIDDVVFGRRTDRDRLDRVSLIDVLGAVVFDRLALHALTLGYDDPLTGTWVTEPTGPRLLRVYSGDRQVAELLDSDRDDRVEVLYVAQLR